MAKLNVFNFMTLNGFYKGVNEDISWHSHEDAEASQFAAESSGLGGMLLFGRVTYQMMESFWPTPAAAEAYPKVAEGMNKMEKVVFSNTLKSADWHNSRVVSGDIAAEVTKLKKGTKDMTILGSGTVVSQLADARLIDSYMLMIDPVALGQGTPMFSGIKDKLEFELVDWKKFKSGILLLTYRHK
jgi:dihydrofolate reductase